MFSRDGENPGLLGKERNSDFRDITSELPSGGKHYPKGARVYLRPFYYKETRDMVSNYEQFKSIVDLYESSKLGIDCEGMSVDELYLGDFLYVTFYRKILTFGTTKLDIVVESNEVPYRGVLKISDIEFRETEAPKFPVRVKLGTDKEEVAFYPVTVGQYIKYLKEHLNQHPDELDELEMSCRGIGSEVFDRIYSESDKILLKKVRQLIDFGIKPITMKMKNLITDKEESVTYCPDSLDTLVFPYSDESEGLDDNQISFG
ncbi:hypothetical protein [Vibrio phage Va2]|nr:hypothetical protein [Vibrio phage Va2]